MSNRIKNIVIIGGGTAGWITAGLLAARHTDRSENGLKITLIESPIVSTVGVGEGTWPTIRQTLSRIGIKEADLLTHCGASFKQGSRFDGWVNGEDGDQYFHPFELPVSQQADDLLQAWQNNVPEKSFADAVCIQSGAELKHLAPRQRTMPEYVGAMNYAYHLDAVKLADLLKTHICGTLGVVHIKDHVTEVQGSKAGDIESVQTRSNGQIDGDLFIDCTGQASLLLGQHYGVKFVNQTDILFNDRAIVTKVPVNECDPIQSETISTAHEAGWIWDIGLPERRGVGCVYSSKYMSDARAEAILRAYTRSDNASLTTRKLKFRSGHRTHFWHNNCLAIGLSAGFLEPLEASAIVLVELSAEALSDNLPATRETMRIESKRFNETFQYRWRRIIDFLKLHYVLSRRPEPYWQDNRNTQSIPHSLQDLLELWKHRPPNAYDFGHAKEIFPASSYQFIAYGMGMAPIYNPTRMPMSLESVQKKMQAIISKRRTFAAGLPTNRALLLGLQKKTKVK